LADVIIKLTKSDSQLVFHPLPSDDPTNRKPDIQKAQLLLDWNPEYNLIDGITKTIDYFKKC
jgi:UDP-glucuronate decarboxylase